MGNISNGALIAQEGDWIFYIDQADGCLYKMREDGSEITKIGQEEPDEQTFLNISDFTPSAVLSPNGARAKPICV
ncbi:MAG: DUF5050 domain-containing protein [Oscillospiraceae bacterium]|nr:DUF5050 domain-containing protein [Oscillospiraceae bacterium]